VSEEKENLSHIFIGEGEERNIARRKWKAL